MAIGFHVVLSLGVVDVGSGPWGGFRLSEGPRGAWGAAAGGGHPDQHGPEMRIGFKKGEVGGNPERQNKARTFGV